jgi:16S rRNA (cytosine967-C5)-methyltransferase
VIRRHPDIKLLRREQDLDALTRTQAAMLEALWPALEPNGRLLYVTCSILPEENEAQISGFLARHGDATEIPLSATLGLARPHGRQLLPEHEGPDGFYFALLAKQGPERGGEARP